MYKIVLLALLSAFSSLSQGAFASPLEGGGVMLMAKRNMMVVGATWKNPYITDGLIAMWDGEWNVGGGVHSDNPDIWVDISGNGQNARPLTEHQKFDKNSLVYESSNTEGWVVDNLTEEFRNLYTTIGDFVHIEIAVKQKSQTNNAIIVHAGYYHKIMARFAANNLYISTPRIGQFGTYLSGSYGLSYCDIDHTIPNVVGRIQRMYYKNGVLAYDSGVFNASSYRDKITSPLYFGNVIESAYTGLWSGNLYNFRIYKRKLTDAEVAANYAIDKARFGLP